MSVVRWLGGFVDSWNWSQNRESLLCYILNIIIIIIHYILIEIHVFGPNNVNVVNLTTPGPVNLADCRPNDYTVVNLITLVHESGTKNVNNCSQFDYTDILSGETACRVDSVS